MTYNLKKDFLAPIGVLFTICLVISVALAWTNQLTAPIIAQVEWTAANEAKLEVLPLADDFTLVEQEGLPAGVTEVYKAHNGAGYVILMTADGYGGDMKMICGIDSKGLVVNVQVLSHSETSGIGTKVTREEFAAQFVGMDADLAGVQAITGASVSSNAYIAAVRSAVSAYKMVEGGGW